MIYVYGCRTCDHEQEEQHSIKESPTIACAKCGSTDTRRLLQELTFSIRGQGVFSPGTSLNRKKPKKDKT